LIGNANPGRENPVRHQMLNLHDALHSLIDDRATVQILVFGIVGVLCLAYLAIDQRRKASEREGERPGEGRAELLSLSMTAVVTLLVAYHRFYDAVVLLLPAALAVRLLAEGNATSRRVGWGILAMLVPFIVPVTPLLVPMMEHRRIPAWIADSTWWN